MFQEQRPSVRTLSHLAEDDGKDKSFEKSQMEILELKSMKLKGKAPWGSSSRDFQNQDFCRWDVSLSFFQVPHESQVPLRQPQVPLLCPLRVLRFPGTISIQPGP